MRLWGGRFAADSDEDVVAFGRSIDVDVEMALDDLDGSVAHVRGLGRAGILSPAEVTALIDGLAGLRRDVENGELRWDPALEDVHLNLEAALTERLAPIPGKLHTGRPRNHHVATHPRLLTAPAVDRPRPRLP